MLITADTITDEQICALRDEATPGHRGEYDVFTDCQISLGADPTSRIPGAKKRAKKRLADILNARNARKERPMLTAETITDEQIRTIKPKNTGEADTVHAALHHRDLASRARCAALLDAAERIRVGMRVHMITRGGSHGSDTGTVRELVTPKGRRRALVAWDSDHCDQFVDVDKLTEAE